MELLALIIINIVVAFILYYAVSIRVLAGVKDSGNKKLLKEVESHINALFETSETYLNLLDSRIVIIRNLLTRLDEKEKSLAELYKKSGKEPLSLSSEILKEKMQQEEYSDIMVSGIGTEYLKNEIITTRDEIQNTLQKVEKRNNTPLPQKIESEGEPFALLATLGRGVKSLFGVKDIEYTSPKQKTTSIKTSAIDLTVSGNPLLETKEFKDNKSQIDTFREVFDSIQGVAPPKLKDYINISIKTVLKEIPEDSSKIDKVVFLLKKKFPSEEIADELGIAVPEVELIRTFRLGKNG